MNEVYNLTKLAISVKNFNLKCPAHQLSFQVYFLIEKSSDENLQDN